MQGSRNFNGNDVIRDENLMECYLPCKELVEAGSTHLTGRLGRRLTQVNRRARCWRGHRR